MSCDPRIFQIQFKMRFADAMQFLSFPSVLGALGGSNTRFRDLKALIWPGGLGLMLP